MSEGQVAKGEQVMANTFVMSARQSAELDYAFERNGWSAADVKWLSEGTNLTNILKVRHGTMEIVPTPLLNVDSRITSFAADAIPTPFRVGDYFKLGGAVSPLGDNFRNWFLRKEEKHCTASALAYGTLSRNSVDGPIIEAIGGEEKAEALLAQVWLLMQAQNDGSDGPLLVNGYANIFYVRDTADVLRAVYVYWLGDGWYVFALAVTRPGTWLAGYRVFSRNSR